MFSTRHLRRTWAAASAVVLVALIGCESSNDGLRAERRWRCPRGKVAMAPAARKGDTHEYYLTLATAEMERQLRKRRVDFVTPGEVVAQYPRFFSREDPGCIQPGKGIAELLDAMRKRGVATLIVMRVEVSGQSKVVVSRRRTPVSDITDIFVRPKPPTAKLFHTVDILFNLLDTADGRVIYVSRAYDNKRTDEPDEMVISLSKKLAKRAKKALEERCGLAEVAVTATEPDSGPSPSPSP